MAADLVKKGKKVIIAGRTESKLKETAKEIGAEWYILDTGDTKSIPAFIDRIIKEHPELDAVINNAGVQRPFELFGPDYDFDLAKADQEIDINIRGPLHLCVGLIQKHFVNLDKAVIMNVSSVLGFIPFAQVNPVYNGTKAWLHFFSTNLRGMVEGKNIKVIEIVPPSVETDLHRERVDPDDNKKHKGSNAQSIDEFMADVNKAWAEDKDTIAPGLAQEIVDDWEGSMGQRLRTMFKK